MKIDAINEELKKLSGLQDNNPLVPVSFIVRRKVELILEKLKYHSIDDRG